MTILAPPRLFSAIARTIVGYHMPDWGVLAQKAAEKHLAACMEAMFAMDEGEEEVESPASATFCGCDTCIVREVLYAAWPILERWALEEGSPTVADTIPIGWSPPE